MDSRAAVHGATISCPKERNTAKPSFRKQTCPYPGRFAYIHAHPLMIVDIDTIASDDGGHRGPRGGGGEKLGWIVGQGEYTVSTKLNVMYGGRSGSVRTPGGGEVYVCARERRMRCSMADDTDEDIYGTG